MYWVLVYFGERTNFGRKRKINTFLIRGNEENTLSWTGEENIPPDANLSTGLTVYWILMS